MKDCIKITALIWFWGFYLLITGCHNRVVFPLTYAEPESKGFSTEKLDTLKAFLKESGASSMILLIDGEVIFDWGNTSEKHLIHSMRKALLNSIIGIAVEQGKIDTSITLGELGIQDNGPELSEMELSATVADLLKSRSGVYHDAAAVSQGMRNNMPARNSCKPGEHFYYNNWDFNALGAILEQQTGESLYKLFLEEIAKPIGMQDYKGKYTSIDGESESGVAIPPTDGFYQYERSKSIYPAYHFRMSSRDLALYGQLYLNNGRWNDKQIVPREWIKASLKPYSVYNEQYHLAYGMLWRLRLAEDNSLRAFFHTGVGIHMLAIYPNSKLVLVHRVDTENNYHYNGNDIYKMLRLVFDAEIK